MKSTKKRVTQIVLCAGLFIAGIAAGSLEARRVAGQNRFGQPKTVLHVVIYKFKDATSNNDREMAVNGIKEMAGKIPGIKNVWLKTERNQIKDSAACMRLNSRAQKLPQTMPRAPFMKLGPKSGRNCERTAFPSRSRIHKGSVNRTFLQRARAEFMSRGQFRICAERWCLPLYLTTSACTISRRQLTP